MTVGPHEVKEGKLDRNIAIQKTYHIEAYYSAYVCCIG